MMARSRKKTSSVKVNFKGVESRKTPPEGDYVMKVLEAKSDRGPSGDMIAFVCEITKGEYKGVKGYLYCPLTENSLWKLHAFLTALGEEVPEDEMEIDLPELIDKEFVGVMTHEIYNGKKRAKLTDFDSLDNYDGEDTDEDEDEDEDDAPKKGKKSKSKGKPAKGKKSKSDDDDEDEDEDEDDEDEKSSKKSKKSKSKKSSKKDDDDDEDDEDDEPKSKKGKGKPAKKSKKKTWSTDDVEDMDEDELEELLEEAGLDDEVDLDDYKNLKKKVAAVLEALEEADLLEDDDD
jgi:hypothetical protein